jgi:energy-coupling factor transport system permease protein
LCCLASLSKTWLILLVVLAVQGVLCRMSLRETFQVVGSALPLALLSFGFQAFLTAGPPIWPSFPWLTMLGIERGAELALRMILLAYVCQIFVASTSPNRFCDALEWFLHPLTWIKLPVRELCLVASLSLRFIPVLSFEAERLIQAQSARGAYLDNGPWHKRVPGLMSILIPLLVRVFRYSDDLSIAMESRGYCPDSPRTRLYPLEFSRADLSGLLVLFGLISIYFGSWRSGGW